MVALFSYSLISWPALSSIPVVRARVNQTHRWKRSCSSSPSCSVPWTTAQGRKLRSSVVNSVHDVPTSSTTLPLLEYWARNKDYRPGSWVYDSAALPSRGCWSYSCHGWESRSASLMSCSVGECVPDPERLLYTTGWIHVRCTITHGWKDVRVVGMQHRENAPVKQQRRSMRRW